MVQGEIGMKIQSIKLTRFRDEDNYDMTLIDTNGNHFHIVGDNDLKFLLENALNDIQSYP